VNKLGSLALIAFLILGGLMWYLAKGSMQQYIEQYQQDITLQLPKGSIFSLGHVDVLPNEHQGSLSKLSLSVPNKGDSPTSITTEDIYWNYDKRSLKTSTVIVNSLRISNIQFRLSINQPKSALNLISDTFKALTARAIKQQTGLNSRQEFQVNINKVTIENLYITLMDKDTPIKELIVNDIKLSSENLPQDQQMSVTGALILQSIANKTNEVLVEQGK